MLSSCGWRLILSLLSVRVTQLPLKKYDTAAFSYCHSLASECFGCSRTLGCVLINRLRGQGRLFIFMTLLCAPPALMASIGSQPNEN